MSYCRIRQCWAAKGALDSRLHHKLHRNQLIHLHVQQRDVHDLVAHACLIIKTPSKLMLMNVTRCGGHLGTFAGPHLDPYYRVLNTSAAARRQPVSLYPTDLRYGRLRVSKSRCLRPRSLGSPMGHRRHTPSLLPSFVEVPRAQVRSVDAMERVLLGRGQARSIHLED